MKHLIIEKYCVKSPIILVSYEDFKKDTLKIWKQENQDHWMQVSSWPSLVHENKDSNIG